MACCGCLDMCCPAGSQRKVGVLQVIFGIAIAVMSGYIVTEFDGEIACKANGDTYAPGEERLCQIACALTLKEDEEDMKCVVISDGAITILWAGLFAGVVFTILGAGLVATPQNQAVLRLNLFTGPIFAIAFFAYAFGSGVSTEVGGGAWADYFWPLTGASCVSAVIAIASAHSTRKANAEELENYVVRRSDNYSHY